MNRKGITFLEIAVVLMIIGLAAVFMSPAIGEWIDNFRLKQSARDIASMMQAAKLKAISSRREYRVVFDIENDIFWLERGNKANGSDTWTKEETEQKVERNVDIQSATSLTFQFNPNGTAQSGHICLKSQKSEKEKKIVISTTGRIRIVEGC